MRSGKRIIIIFFLTVLAISAAGCLSLINNQNKSSFDPLSSTVVVENGVSGVVTIKDPYLNKTVDQNINYNPLTKGSGVIVTSNGYIVTAFHVIGDPKTVENGNQLKVMDDNDVKQYLAQIAATDYVKEQNPRLINELTNSNMSFDINDTSTVQLLTQLLAENNLISYKSSKQVIKVKLPSRDPIQIYNTNNAQLIDVGNANTLEDVALLKINSTNNLPFLSLNPQNPAIGENVTVYGYPGTSGTQNLGSTQPTTNNGTIISRVSNNYGVLYYETDANTATGISGGPVLDKNNKILGILVYGIQQNNYRTSITSDNSLFLSSNYMIDICKKNNVTIST